MGLLTRKKKEENQEQVSTNQEAVSNVENNSVVEKKDKSGCSVKSNRVIIKPVITEKSAIDQSLNKYTFIVTNDATSYSIKKAIKEIYSVEPVKVNLVNVQGKIRRFGKSKGRRSDYKKAVITLPQGKSIAIHEGV